MSKKNPRKMWAFFPGALSSSEVVIPINCPIMWKRLLGGEKNECLFIIAAS